MNRRRFLKSVIVGAAAATVPLAVKSNHLYLASRGIFIFNPDWVGVIDEYPNFDPDQQIGFMFSYHPSEDHVDENGYSERTSRNCKEHMTMHVPPEHRSQVQIMTIPGKLYPEHDTLPFYGHVGWKYTPRNHT